MNKLLVHGNNTSFNRYDFFTGTEQFVFDIDIDKDVDLYINEILEMEITEGLKKRIEKSDIVFIKIALTQNYLEYFGLRLAYHIRLAKNLGEKSKIPIVFIAEESFQFLGSTCHEPSILFTKGIYLIKETLEDLEDIKNRYANGSIKPLDGYDSFINSILIHPPSNYKSHHSIANEWAIYRWATALQINDDQIRTIEKTIGSNLYFKYLQFKYPIAELSPVAETTEPANRVVPKRGNVLCIDDEVNKGWHSIFTKICSDRLFKSQFESIGGDFKNLSKEEIIENSLGMVKGDFNPDIVILDFRLHDDDFEDAKSFEPARPEDVTGYKILVQIKAYNPGIQVIVLSATNKIWNFMELHAAGADDFIIKESPELSVDENYSRKAIDKIYKSIEKGLTRAKYLKHAFNFLNESNEILENKNIPDELKTTIKKQLELSYFLLSRAGKEEEFAYAFVALYMIIESINKEFVIKSSNYKWIFNNGGNDLDLLDWGYKEENQIYTNTNTPVTGTQPPEWQKLAGLYFQIWNGEDHGLIRTAYHLIKKRNGFIHNDKKILDYQDNRGNYLNHDIFTPNGTISLFECIGEIFKSIQTKDTAIEKKPGIQ